MHETFTLLLAFFEAHGLWIGIGSAAMFIISLASVPFIVARIPVDYFTHRGRQRLSRSSHHPAVRLLLSGFKNLVGAMLLMAGFIMLFTPGQGLLTILFGLMIMNYPGKYRLERRIIRKPAIFGAVNAMRRTQGQDPLHRPDSSP